MAKGVTGGQMGEKLAVSITSPVLTPLRTWERTLSLAAQCQEETLAYRIFLPGCLASSRQLLMKSCARGLMVRFFNKTIPTGTWPNDCLMGRTCNFGRQPENLNTEFGKIEIKRPVASRLIRSSEGSPITVVRG